MCAAHNYPVVVVLVLLLVEVEVLVDVLVVLVLVDVELDVLVLVLVEVEENLNPSQLLPEYLNQAFWVVSQYSSPLFGAEGAEDSVLILPVMLVMCVFAMSLYIIQ